MASFSNINLVQTLLVAFGIIGTLVLVFSLGTLRPAVISNFRKKLYYTLIGTTIFIIVTYTSILTAYKFGFMGHGNIIVESPEDCNKLDTAPLWARCPPL
ncbi:hypothetical protein [Mesorhizobium loti]|uniref:hypothetical protein n=1 Tax=Rhizobium loti TaxID=381 RepID=UPI0012BCF982|nr:hypothetical protein [Mesorhizobium loti]